MYIAIEKSADITTYLKSREELKTYVFENSFEIRIGEVKIYESREINVSIDLTEAVLKIN